MKKKKRQVKKREWKRVALPVSPGRVIRSQRVRLGWTATGCAQKAGVNVRTLNAIEMGRIETPSLQHLYAISKALGVSLSSIFSEQSKDRDWMFLLGDKKGQEIIEFPKDGFRLVCYTPLIYQFFVGKVILNRGRKISLKALPLQGLVFAQPILGKLTLHFDQKEHLVREGDYVFFDATLPHAFENPAHREISFLLVTAPSFLAAR